MPTCSGVCANPVATAASPMPMKNTTIMPSRLHLSASHPAGYENTPKAKKQGVAYFKSSP